MSISGIQGQTLEVTVVCCNKLKDTEWISRQDPYVCLEYGSTRFRTRTCTDGGKNPTFQEKFVFSLIEGLRELSVSVYNSNTVSTDDFIGSGKIQLQKVLSQNYDDSSWSIQSHRGRHSGEVRLIMHYSNANINKPAKNQAPTAPSHAGVPAPHAAPLYAAPPSVTYPQTGYPAPPLYPSYPPYSAGYPSTPYPPAAYPPTTYPPTTYPPTTYPPTYPPAAYPPHPTYPPPPQDQHHYPPGSYPQSPYPPPPY